MFTLDINDDCCLAKGHTGTLFFYLLQNSIVNFFVAILQSETLEILTFDLMCTFLTSSNVEAYIFFLKKQLNYLCLLLADLQNDLKMHINSIN